MTQIAYNSGANGWISVAAYEISQIQRRWELLSWRQLSEVLYIDRRTLSKLDFRHPDGSLTLETLDRIYATLWYLSPLYFTAEEKEEEKRRLAESRMRILLCSEIHPEIKKLFNDVGMEYESFNSLWIKQ